MTPTAIGPVRAGVAVILRKGGSILMGKRRGSHGAGTWSFPGGHLEPGETVAGCGARELWEETGIAADPARMKKFTFTNDVFEAEGKHYVTLYVECEAWESMEEAVLREPDKCEEWRFFEAAPSPLFLPIKNLLFDHDIWRKS